MSMVFGGGGMMGFGRACIGRGVCEMPCGTSNVHDTGNNGVPGYPFLHSHFLG